MTTHDGSLGFDEATLSALVDGELAPAESRRALERVARDARLRARWGRYHAVRAACEGAARDCLRPGFSARVRAALADEPTVVAARGLRGRSRLHGGPFAGFAIAASAGLIALGGLLAIQSQERTPAPQDGAGAIAERGIGPGGGARGGARQTEDGAASTVAADGSEVARLVDGVRPVSLADVAGGSALEDQPRMAIYLSRHSAYAGAGEIPDLVPYSRLASYHAAR